LNRIRAFQRAAETTGAGGGEPESRQPRTTGRSKSDLSRQWEEDHDKHGFGNLLALVQPDFQPAPWEAFTRFALNGRPGAQVAEELGTTESIVMNARFRVLERPREEAGDPIDSGAGTGSRSVRGLTT
jgi:hypothetical protein